MTQRLISTGAAARILGVTSQTIRDYIDAKKIAATKTLGGQNRLKEADILFLKAERADIFD